MDLNQFDVKVIIIRTMLLTFSGIGLLNSGFKFLHQQQEIKYLDFGEENEKGSEDLKSEIDPQWKIDLMLISSRSNYSLSNIRHYVDWKVCSKDDLEIPTPPPKNRSLVQRK